jgi:hypothetical protein
MLFREGGSTRVILSDGLTLRIIEAKIWCDFSPYCSEPDSVDDFRKSDFYVVGASVRWEVQPYCEEP